jgi:polar amino acid transport system permease protein
VTDGYHPSDIQQGRTAYRRRRAVRSVLLAAVSTGVLGTLLVVAVTGSPGWERVRSSFFDWELAKE